MEKAEGGLTLTLEAEVGCKSSLEKEEIPERSVKQCGDERWKHLPRAASQLCRHLVDGRK